MSVTSPAGEQFPVRVFGGPTAQFEYGGLWFLTDPTFDAPGDYRRPGHPLLVKTAPASGSPADLGRVDVVLLSHDEHADNLDNSGRALLADIPLTLTTPAGGRRLGDRAKGLADWESIELDRPGGGTTMALVVDGAGTAVIGAPSRPRGRRTAGGCPRAERGTSRSP